MSIRRSRRLAPTGLLLIAGRLIHACGVGREPEVLRIRVAGMALTFTVLIVAALANIVLSFKA